MLTCWKSGSWPIPTGCLLEFSRASMAHVVERYIYLRHGTRDDKSHNAERLSAAREPVWQFTFGGIASEASLMLQTLTGTEGDPAFASEPVQATVKPNGSAWGDASLAT